MERRQFSLVGVDGNAFSIIAYVNMAMRQCGKSPRERNAYMQDAMGSGDYCMLIAKSQDMIDTLNSEQLQ